MWFAFRSEDLSFLDRARTVHVAEAVVAAPRAAVFAAIADAGSWPRWFPNVRAACYVTPSPHGVGTVREARVGGTRWTETMIAWDDRCWAWTVTRASVPFAAAQVERFAFEDAGSGTRVRWTVALEPRLLARLGAPLAARTIPRLFTRAMQNLDAYLLYPGGIRP